VERSERSFAVRRRNDTTRLFWVQVVALLLLAAPPAAGADATATLIVQVAGLRSDDGQVRALLFRGEDGFPGELESAAYSAEASIRGGVARLQYPGLPPGDYAVTIFHDENGNASLDMNFMGWPREGVGASQRAHRRMGPPRYRDARFEVAPGTKTERIEVLYPPL